MKNENVARGLNIESKRIESSNIESKNIESIKLESSNTDSKNTKSKIIESSDIDSKNTEMESKLDSILDDLISKSVEIFNNNGPINAGKQIKANIEKILEKL